MRTQSLDVTFDTNCIMSLLNLPSDKTPAEDIQALRQIMQWRDEKRLTVWVSEKSLTEAEKNLEKSRQSNSSDAHIYESKWLYTVKVLGSYPYPPLSGRFHVGKSKLGVDTRIASDSSKQDFEGISKLLFKKSPQDLKQDHQFDVIILFEHYIQGNDLFVTRDPDIFKKETELKAKWGISVSKPIEAEKKLSLMW